MPRVGPSEVPVPGFCPSEFDGVLPEDTEGGVPDEVDDPFGLPSEVVPGVPDGTDVFGEVFVGIPGDTCVIIGDPDICPGVEVDAPIGLPSEVVAGVPDVTDVFGEVFADTPGDTCVIIEGPDVCPAVDVEAPAGCPLVTGRVYIGEVLRVLAAGGVCVVADACFCTLFVGALDVAVAAGAGLCAAAGLCCCL